MNELPVFVINGFLDSGKTTFTQAIIMADGFFEKGNTLLIMLEEGEVEYDEALLLDKYNTTVLVINRISEIEKEKYAQLVDMHNISRIIIENNAMLDEKFDFPDFFKIYQVITLIDAQSFEIQYANLRMQMANMIRPSNMVIFNRIEDRTNKLLSYKRSLMLLNNEAEYIFQGSNGELIETLVDELPYNINDDIIHISDDDYGVFYIDSYDNKERYDGKKIRLNTTVYLDGDIVVLGRLTMTCCENDITLLGFITDLDDAFNSNEWLNILAKISYKVINDREEPVFEVIEYKRIKQIEKPIVNL